MKIAFLTPEYPHVRTGKAGGIGTSILNISKGLIALNHTVVILIYGQDKDAYFKDNDIHFYKIKNIKVKGLSFYLTQKKLQRLINKLHQEKKIDIVESPDWTGFSAFVAPKCPLVIRQNGSDTYFCHLDKRQVKFKNKFLEKRALKKADGIISVSAFTGTLTNKLFNLNRVFTVIPNSIDVDAFKPMNNNNEKQIILYFGTLIRKKGVLELASIFNMVNEKNKDVELVLVGKDSPDILSRSPSTWQLMKPLFSASALEKVNYKGPVDYSEIQNLIKQATICVFPTFAEALPVSWLEAMAMEKAIVASNVGWAKEMINDGVEGYLVHPTDHKLYSKQILELVDNSNKQESFGAAARLKVKNDFSNNVIAEKSVNFYNKYIKV